MANYTKKAILATFESMLNEMPFEKITISALVIRCEISPNTFYYHYHDIYDLLEAWMEEKRKLLLKDLPPQQPWEIAALKKLFHLMQDHPNIVNHLFNSISSDRLERYIFDRVETLFRNLVHERMADLCVSEETETDIACLYCYSILGFAIKFIWTGMSADVDTSVDRIMDSFDFLVRKAAPPEGQTRT